MKKILIACLLALTLIVPAVAFALPTSLDFDPVTRVLQPLVSQVNARIFGSSFHATSTATSSTFANLNGTLYADHFPGSDIGAKVNAAYAQLPAAGGKIVITASSTFSTPMIFDTANKHVLLECDPGVTLNYTGTGSSTVFATFVYPDYPTDAGIDGCTFDGPSGSTVVGISLGNSSGGAAGYNFRNFIVRDFGINIVSGANTYLTSFDNFKSENGNRNLVVYEANNSGENLRFSNGLIGDCKTIAGCVYFATSSSASTLWEGMSIDNAQLVVAPGNFNFKIVGGHGENPAAAGAVIGKYPHIINMGETTSISGMSFVNMATSSAQTPDCYVVNTGYLNVFSASVWSANSISAPSFVCNSSSATANIYGFNELGTSVDGIATTSVGFYIADNRNVGIGTSSPAGLFDVNGSAFFGNQSGTAQLTLRAGSGRNGTIAQEGTSATSAIAINSNGSIDFRTDGASRMYFTDVGLVGIGTTNPGSALQVAGTTTSAGLSVGNLTGLAKLTSGALGVATAGVDYLTSIASSTVRGMFSSSATGLTYNSSTGDLSLDSGYVISTTTRETNQDTAFSWGNHASAGYLTSYTETDPIFGASAASGITNTLISNWNTAHSWGNHASSSYLTAIATTTVRGMFSSSATGLTYNSATGDFSLTAGYGIPTTASTTAWEAFYQTPSTRITAGTGLSWSGNTLNATGGGTGDVVGPSAATDNAVARFDTTTGKLIQNSSTTITDNGNIATGDATGDRSITINSGSSRSLAITQVGSAANSPARFNSNGALQLEVDAIPRITIGEFGDITFGATTTAPTTTISRLTIGSLTGLLKATSGLVSTAVAGTDYVADVTGDWTGTFDGQEGTWYRDRANHTGTQSSTTITGLGTLAGFSTVPLTTHVSGVLPEANGGTNQSTYTTGDMLYASGANTLAKRAIGSTGNVLSVVGGVPTWVATGTLGITGGGGGGGSGTVNSGTTGQIARYDSSGTAVTGTSTVFIADNGTVQIGSPSISPDIPLIIERNAPADYSSVAVRNSAADGRSQVTFSNGLGSNYYDCFVGSSGSSTANYPNTMEIGCGFAGSGINFWSDGFLQARMATSGNMGFGTTTNLLSKLSVQTDNSNSGSSLFTAYNSTGAAVAIITNAGTFNSNGGYRTPFSGVGYAVTSGTATTSSVIMDFFAASNQAVMRGYESNGIGFRTGAGTPAERMRITQDGRVMIGSTTATGTLAIQSGFVGQDILNLFDSVGSAIVNITDTLATFFTNAWFKGDVVVDGTLDFNLPFRKYVEFFDDYLTETTNAGDAPWAESVTGTSAACTNQAISVGNRPGMTRCTTGTTATGRAGLTTGLTAVALGQGTTTYKTAVNVTTLSTVTERYSLRVGFQDTAAAAQVDAVYLLYDEGGVTTGSTASANWQCVTASNSTRTYTDTGTAVSAGGWDDIEIIVNAAGTSVDFYIDGVLECTHTTNIPTGTARALGHGVQALKSIGTTARTFDYDYQYARHEFTTAR